MTLSVTRLFRFATLARHTALLASLAAAASVGCGAQADGVEPSDDGAEAAKSGTPAETPEVGQSKAKVEWAYGNYMAYDVNNFKSTVSSVIRFPWLPDGSLWASCGATFISHHFAVTAAHCVPKSKIRIDNNDTMDAGDQNFFVSNIGVDSMVNRINGGDTNLAWKVLGAAVIGGTWPNYTHPNPPVGAADGYAFREGLITCRVRVRAPRSSAWTTVRSASPRSAAVRASTSRSSTARIARRPPLRHRLRGQ